MLNNLINSIWLILDSIYAIFDFAPKMEITVVGINWFYPLEVTSNQQNQMGILLD